MPLHQYISVSVLHIKNHYVHHYFTTQNTYIIAHAPPQKWHFQDLERLEMLEVKRQYESERNKLKRVQEQATQREQHAILNKGGAKRPPIKLSLGMNMGGR